MAEVVPKELLFQGRVTHDATEVSLLRIPLFLARPGLGFVITAPERATVDDLAGFVASEVLGPLGRYDNHGPWVQPYRLYLSRHSDTKRPLPGDAMLRSVKLNAGDSLAVVVHEPSVAAPGAGVQLTAVPHCPRPGEPYRAELTCRGTHERLTISVRGTDGYRESASGTGDSLSMTVPGARGGVVDIIAGAAGRTELSIHLLFGERRAETARRSSLQSQHDAGKPPAHEPTVEIPKPVPLSAEETSKLRHFQRLVSKKIPLTASERELLAELESREARGS